MNLAWRATLVTIAAASAFVLVACAAAPVPSPSPATGLSPSAVGTESTPSSSPTPSLSPSPSPRPGPTLTKAEFARLVVSGKIGTRDANLARADITGAKNPDGEAEEDEEQSEAKSCVKLHKLARSRLRDQASDADQQAVLQLFATPSDVADLFTLNRACVEQEAGFSPETALTSVADGSEGSAQWWLTRDPDGNHQATIGYGNVMAFLTVEADVDTAALTRAFASQLDEVGKG